MSIRLKSILFFTLSIILLVGSVEAQEDLCDVCHKGVEMSAHSYCTSWMKDGHPVFVKPSSKVEISPMFPLNEQGQLTCETCHVPDSAPSFEDQQQIFTGKLTLRYSNKDSFLCKQCHVKEFDKNPKKERVNHPANEVMDKIPRALLEAGARATRNKILCETCHKVHQAKGDPLLIMPDGYSELCGNCHPRYFTFDRPWAARKGTHPVDIIPVTASIARTISSMGGKRGGSKKIICLTCHRIHQAPNDKALLITDSKTICKICHEEYVNSVTGTKHDLRVSAPNAINIKKKYAKDKNENVCSPCHLVHGGAGPKIWARPLSGEEDIISQLCKSCHKGKQEEGNSIARTFSGEFSHIVGVKNIFEWGMAKLPLYNDDGFYSANNNVTCATCHNVHQWDPLDETNKGSIPKKGTKANSFLRRVNKNSKLCKICHSSAFAIKGTTHDPGNKSFATLKTDQKQSKNLCEGCHVVHNANGPRLWKFDVGDGDDTITQICNTCHETDGIAKNKTIGSFSHPVDVSTIKIDYSLESELPLFSPSLEHKDKGRVYCNTCHDVHVGPSQNRKKTGKRSSNHNYLRMHGDQPDQLCLTCHQDEKLIKKTKHDMSSTSSSSLDNKLCASCHKVHNASSNFRLWYKTIGEDEEPSSQMCFHCHSEGGMAQKSILEGHSHPTGVNFQKSGEKLNLPLYDEKLKKRKKGNVLCPTCHDVHQWKPGAKEKKTTAKNGDFRDSFLRIVDDKGVELCLECHTDKQAILKNQHNIKFPNEKNLLGKNTEQGGTCSACHLVHRASQGLSLWAKKVGEGPDEISRLCQSCHADGLCAEKKSVGPNSHPVDVSVKRFIKPALPLFGADGKKDQEKGKVACASCHDVHVAMGGNSLRISTENAALCKECHPAELAIAQSSHNITKNKNEVVCFSCHKIHNSKAKLNIWSRDLKKTKYPKEWFKGTNVGKNLRNKYCISCHFSTVKGKFYAYHPGNLFFPQLEIEDSDKYEDLATFVYRYREMRFPLFVEAINSGIRPRYPIFNKSGAYASSGYIVCSTCHDIHRDNRTGPVKGRLLREQIAQRFCSICHAKDAIYRLQYFHSLSKKENLSFNPFADKKETTNLGPHFRQDRCRDCHVSKPSSASNAQILFDGDVVKLCESCHDGKKASREWHKVGMQVEKTTLPLKDKKVTCLTCHDIKSEHSNPGIKKSNPNFLYENDSEPARIYTWTIKDTPLYNKKRVNLCYKCHNEEEYQQFSPHRKQLNRNKDTVHKDMCLICHTEVPNRKTDRIRDFSLKATNTSVCIGCHPGKDNAKHPLEKNHYNLKVSHDVLSTIRQIMRKEKLFIPIVNKRLTCFSCHNAHEKGVLKNAFTRKGSHAKGRLRFGKLEPCSICHTRVFKIPSFDGGGFSPW